MKDVATLRMSPRIDASEVSIELPAGAGSVPAAADTSTPVRQFCHSGAWSRVRILAPEELREGQGWILTSDLVQVNTDAQGRKIYGLTDVQWPTGTAKYKRSVLTIINKIMRTDLRCEAIDGQSLTAVTDQGAGRFIIPCVGPSGTHSISFSASDADSGRSFAQPGSTGNELIVDLGESDARGLCRAAVEQKLKRPATVDYDFGGSTFQPNGQNAAFSLSGTVKNDLDGSVAFKGRCLFVNGSLSSSEVSEG